MKYRITVLVSAGRLADVVAAAFGGKLDYDPELKIWPASQPTGEREIVHALYSGLERVEPKPKKPEPAKRSGNNKGTSKRAELVAAALKTGPKRWGELKTALVDGGLSESSLNNFISQWQKAGKIRRSEDGLWSLNDAPQAANAG
jgi:hypothetical protein